MANLGTSARRDLLLPWPVCGQWRLGCLRRLHGSPFKTSMLSSRLFGEEAELISSGPGKYLVLYPGLGYAQNADGGVYEIDLRAFLDR